MAASSAGQRLFPILFRQVVTNTAKSRVYNAQFFAPFFWYYFTQNGLAIVRLLSDICTTRRERQVHIMQMNIKFELGPKQRPKLAEEIAAALHTIPCYQRLPSCSYKIGDLSAPISSAARGRR